MFANILKYQGYVHYLQCELLESPITQRLGLTATAYIEFSECSQERQRIAEVRELEFLSLGRSAKVK
jgi:hypothetical protein